MSALDTSWQYVKDIASDIWDADKALYGYIVGDEAYDFTANVLTTEKDIISDAIDLPGETLDVAEETVTTVKNVANTTATVAPYAISSVAVIAALVAVAYVVRAFK